MLRNVYMFGIPNMFRNYIYIYTYIHIFIYIYIHIYIYVCMYACMYACMCVYICIYAHILYWSTAMIYLELLSPFFRLDCVVFLRPSPSVFIKFASTSPPSRKRFCYLIRSKKNAKLILACHVQIQIWTAHARDAR